MSSHSCTLCSLSRNLVRGKKWSGWTKLAAKIGPPCQNCSVCVRLSSRVLQKLNNRRNQQGLQYVTGNSRHLTKPTHARAEAARNRLLHHWQFLIGSRTPYGRKYWRSLRGYVNWLEACETLTRAHCLRKAIIVDVVRNNYLLRTLHERASPNSLHGDAQGLAVFRKHIAYSCAKYKASKQNFRIKLFTVTE